MAHRELAWLFHEPHTGLDDCLRMLQACFRKRMSEPESEGGCVQVAVGGGGARVDGIPHQLLPLGGSAVYKPEVRDLEYHRLSYFPIY